VSLGVYTEYVVTEHDEKFEYGTILHLIVLAIVQLVKYRIMYNTKIIFL